MEKTNIKEDDINQKSVYSYCMNSLWEHTEYLTQYRVITNSVRQGHNQGKAYQSLL